MDIDCSPPAADVRGRQVGRLRQFLKYDTLIEFGAAVATLGMFVAFRSPAFLLVGVVLTGNTLLLLWVRRLIDEARLESAVTIMAVALWIIAGAIAVLLPPAFVVSPLILMESVLLALPYAGRHRLMQLMTCAVLTALLIMPLARNESGPFALDMLPGWFILVILAASVPILIGIMLYFAWQYSDLLGETLAETQSANTALAASQKQLAANVQELQQSRVRIVQVQEGVRQEIAAHLHGRVQGRLLVIRARILKASDEPLVPTGIQIEFREIAEALAELVAEDLSRLSRRLYPAILRQGLVPAIESLADQFEHAVETEVRIEPGLRAAERTNRELVPEPTRLAVYRITEEALSNVVKHANASAVSLSLERSPDRALRLSFVDDGCGFDTGVAVAGLGLAAIRDQASVVGGISSVRSTLGEGTEIVATLPLAERH